MRLNLVLLAGLALALPLSLLAGRVWIDPLDPQTQMGPLISAGRREQVASYVPADAPVAVRGTAPDGDD